MRLHDSTSKGSFNTLIKRLVSNGRKHTVRIGFVGAISMITLAGMYAIFGGASDKPLDTTSSSQSSQSQSADGTNKADPVQGESMTDNASDETKQQSADSTTNTTNQSQSSTTVTINGQQVAVPANGTVHQTINDGNSHTEITVNSNHSSTSTTGSGGSASNNNNSSVNMNITSKSSSSSP